MVFTFGGCSLISKFWNDLYVLDNGKQIWFRISVGRSLSVDFFDIQPIFMKILWGLETGTQIVPF